MRVAIGLFFFLLGSNDVKVNDPLSARENYGLESIDDIGYRVPPILSQSGDQLHIDQLLHTSEVGGDGV